MEDLVACHGEVEDHNQPNTPTSIPFQASIRTYDGRLQSRSFMLAVSQQQVFPLFLFILATVQLI